MLPINTPQAVGANISGRRKQLGLSQKQVASRLSLSQNRLSELESRPETLTVEQLLALVNVLGLELYLCEPGAVRRRNVEW